jgi:hypothetical protein
MVFNLDDHLFNSRVQRDIPLIELPTPMQMRLDTHIINEDVSICLCCIELLPDCLENVSVGPCLSL